MNLLRGILTQFRKNRKVYIFFICFVIAAMFWFLLALTRDYPATIAVNVTYENFPPHLVAANELPEKFTLEIKTSGYRIMTMGSKAEQNSLAVDVLSLTGIEPGVKTISSNVLAANFIQQLGSDVEINSIVPDSIMFDLSPSASVRLPVKAKLDVSFERQFDAVSPVRIVPDSVTAMLPYSLLGKINWIETESISARQLRSSLKQKVKLVIPQGASLSLNEAEVNLEVEKFTEGSAEVPVSIINLPNGLQVKIFPSRVNVKYQVALSKYDKVKSDMFTVVADASETTSGNGDKLAVKVISSPTFVRSVSLQPEKVDFILKK
jgi:hypothetical protein